MKKGMTKAVSAIVASVLALSLVACGNSSSTEQAADVTTTTETTTESTESAEASTQSESGDKIVNIASTYQLGTLNPLNMDWSFINLYATSLEFLPLASFNSDNDVDYLLAESITTDDNFTFNIKIRDDAVWSDGEPVTSDDVIFTILRMTSPEVSNYNFDFTNFAGFESGNAPSGAEEIEGLVRIDDKNLQLVSTIPMSLNTFLNNVGTWICILPSHVLKDVPADELLTYDWFNHPDVVSGPYVVYDYDSAHYISYNANENYFLGAPKISKLNILIKDPSELLAGLQSGEIDFIQPTTGSIPLTDQEAVENLEGVTAQWTDPITNEMTYFNTTKVTDARVRKAIVMAIDRETIVNSLLNGHGEVTEGFVMKSSPLYDDSKESIAYDPDGAKALLEEAGWDSSTELQYYVPSSDDTVVKAAQIIQQQLAAVGVKIKINTVDFDTLMSVGGSDEVDFFSVQYTITPNDFYGDERSLIDMEESWTYYVDDEVHAALLKSQEVTETSELAEQYKIVDDKMIEDVPMFSLYFMSNLGVVSDRLTGATASLYGAYNNIQDWDIAE